MFYQFLFTFLLASVASAKIKMIVDTDGVADDVQALTMAFQHPNVDLLAITTVVGSTTASQAIANIARTMRANKVKKNYNLIKGAETNLIGHINTTMDGIYFFGNDGLSDNTTAAPVALPSDKVANVKDLHAAETLVHLCKEHKGEIVVVAIGPLTNLALALELDPDFATYPKQLVLTGGNIYGMGNVRVNSTAEYNFNADPEAAAIVIQRIKCPITIVAWETTFFYQDLQKRTYDFDYHLNLNYPLSKFFNAVTTKPRSVMREIKRQYRYCDEIAMAVAIDPAVATMQMKVPVAVEIHGSMTRGQLVVGWLNDWVPPEMRDPKMTTVQLVLDYDFHEVDNILIDAIKNVPSEMENLEDNTIRDD